MIYAKHDSRDILYRNPFGALPVKGYVRLSIDIKNILPKRVFLRLWDGSERICEMKKKEKKNSSFSYETTIKVNEEPCLLWYYFIIETQEKKYFYGNNNKNMGGEGSLYEYEPPSFQITVYKKSSLPKWLYGGMIYQIFPDRFFNPYDRPLAFKKDSLLHDSWYSPPLYARDVKTWEVLAYDFHGGNFEGIIKKLDYLSDFGVTLIYLNPIFLSVSNHRYDTGDYEKIDPVLGDEETFVKLCREAEKRGIKIILDGVFSHTGSDSKYFNKEGTYENIGAFQSQDSPYYSWFNFTNYPEEYESWWGIGNLPNVNELNEDYLSYMIEDENSIVTRWIKAGAKGWRLDVADELPEEFIRKLRKRIKEVDKESFLLGEVWEDASKKEAYGHLRCYFLGDELDSVMNYPFKQSVISFLKGERSSYDVLNELYSLYENYPKENFHLLMNLLGSHDTVRILTELSGVMENDLTEAQKRKFVLNDNFRQLALKRLWLALVWQMTFTGVPSVYYGDEAGIQGFSDPFNRGPYPWEKEDIDVFKLYWRITSLRNRYDILKKGDWKPIFFHDDIIAYEKYYDGEKAIILLNRSTQERTCVLKEHKNELTDVLSGKVYLLNNKINNITIEPFEAKIMLENIRYPDRRKQAGILCHISSLPSEYGIGDFGESCYNFIDFLVETKHLIWQILPLNSVDNFGSPYAGDSAFAGNIYLISPKLLFEENYLTKEELLAAKALSVEAKNINFNNVRTRKDQLFEKAYIKFKQTKNRDYDDFCIKNQYWLDDYALYAVLKKKFKKPWYEWPKEIRYKDKVVLVKLYKAYAEEIGYYKFLQYEFYRQWSLVSKKASEKGIKIIGDIPIYVAFDSSDVWHHRELFELDDKGMPKSVAGVPPDYFSKTGQLWGNPLYDWVKLKEEKYEWWIKRIEKALELTELLRLDHFRGFDSYWSVPYGNKTAEQGQWKQGPQDDFLRSLKEHFGAMPFIAEDLGIITNSVRKLCERFSLLGMNVLQFGLSEDISKVFYSGTHDNETLLSWIEKNKNHEIIKKVLQKYDKTTKLNSVQITEVILEYIYSSSYIWVIIPIQDLLCLDSKARMNTPGTIKGNWTWRLTKEDVNQFTKEKLKSYVIKGKR